MRIVFPAFFTVLAALVSFPSLSFAQDKADDQPLRLTMDDRNEARRRVLIEADGTVQSLGRPIVVPIGQRVVLRYPAGKRISHLANAVKPATIRIEEDAIAHVGKPSPPFPRKGNLDERYRTATFEAMRQGVGYVAVQYDVGNWDGFSFKVVSDEAFATYQAMPRARVIQGIECAVHEPSERVVADQKSLRELWDQMYADHAAVPDMPEVDFDKQIVVGVFMGDKSTIGHFIRIRRITTDRENTLIHVERQGHHPGENEIVAWQKNQPYQLLVIPKPTKPIKFGGDPRAADPKPAPPSHESIILGASIRSEWRWQANRSGLSAEKA